MAWMDARALRGVRVLVVDDDVDARELASCVLTDAGAEVRNVASASEAMVALAEVHPDVVLSDIRMPHEDGYSLIRRMRAAGNRVPAIALTAYAYPTERSMALDAGFDLHVGKPCPREVLVTMVRKLAGRRSTS